MKMNEIKYYLNDKSKKINKKVIAKWQKREGEWNKNILWNDKKHDGEQSMNARSTWQRHDPVNDVRTCYGHHADYFTVPCSCRFTFTLNAYSSSPVHRLEPQLFPLTTGLRRPNLSLSLSYFTSLPLPSLLPPTPSSPSLIPILN